MFVDYSIGVNPGVGACYLMKSSLLVTALLQDNYCRTITLFTILSGVIHAVRRMEKNFIAIPAYQHFISHLQIFYETTVINVCFDMSKVLEKSLIWRDLSTPTFLLEDLLSNRVAGGPLSRVKNSWKLSCQHVFGFHLKLPRIEMKLAKTVKSTLVA